MDAQFIARRYRYADNVPWNDDRYEIFVKDDGEWVSVGGAIRMWNHRTIAFLCTKGQQRILRTPMQAEAETRGLYVWGDSVMGALKTLKWKYPEPLKLLRQVKEREMAAF